MKTEIDELGEKYEQYISAKAMGLGTTEILAAIIDLARTVMTVFVYEMEAAGQITIDEGSLFMRMLGMMFNKERI